MKRKILPLALLCFLAGCVHTGYNSVTRKEYHSNGNLKSVESKRNVTNTTIYYEAVKDTLTSAYNGLVDFAASPAGTALLGVAGLGGGGLLLRRGRKSKEESYNKGLKVGAQIKAGA